MVDQSLAGYAGIIRTERGDNGALYSLYVAAEAGLDTESGKWATVCETHSTICNHRTYKLARAHLPTGGWCEECMEEDADKRMGRGDEE